VEANRSHSNSPGSPWSDGSTRSRPEVKGFFRSQTRVGTGDGTGCEPLAFKCRRKYCREDIRAKVAKILFFSATQMGSVFFILLAGIGHDFRILARNRQCYGPGFREKFRILECYGPLDAIVVELSELFNQVQLVAMLMAGRVEPGAVIQADGIHDQRVPFPFAGGIPEPGCVHILGMAASIHIDNSERALVLKKDGNHGRRLDDLERHQACLNSSGGTDRQTLG